MRVLWGSIEHTPRLNLSAPHETMRFIKRRGALLLATWPTNTKSMQVLARQDLHAIWTQNQTSSSCVLQVQHQHELFISEMHEQYTNQLASLHRSLI